VPKFYENQKLSQNCCNIFGHIKEVLATRSQTCPDNGGERQKASAANYIMAVLLMIYNNMYTNKSCTPSKSKIQFFLLKIKKDASSKNPISRQK
jgi:hypothetical protein